MPESDYIVNKQGLKPFHVNPLVPAQLLRQVYPKPIQSYKLTLRRETLLGEVQDG